MSAGPGGEGGAAGAGEAPGLVERTFRAESGRVLATLTRTLGDLDAAEDAVQEAFVEAMRTWPTRGAPGRPAAWIMTTARHRALDRLRHESRRPAREAEAGRLVAGDDDPAAAMHERRARAQAADVAGADLHPVDDDQLRLMFTCCHPALAPAAQVALTLRLVCGLRTDEIARAFLQPEPTVYQRLTRAKAKIRATHIPFRVPPGHLLGERLPPVLACVYLVFSEGYASGHGDDLIRHELCDEGVRLARLLAALLPDEPEVHGLLALVLLQDSRRAARLGPDGELVLLEEQDRRRWDRARILEGQTELARSLRVGPAGPYRLQAAIAAVHADAPTWEATDWPRIAALYDVLARRAPSPVVELNRAVAVAFAEGPEAGLAVVEAVAGDPRLARTHLLPATRADLLRRVGRTEEAAEDYRRALTLVRSGAERSFLERRLAELTGP